MFEPQSVDELQTGLAELPRIVVKGGGTKTAMSAPANVSVARLSSIVEYDPAEYTVTAEAGARLADVRDLLARSGQYLPFDPPLVEAGGTLGGTVASGLSGPGRFRYGGVRDFLLGIRWISGDGTRQRGGGKVVKNAAGFDFPKLMVGARGELGVLYEVTFKVFPEPRTYQTILVRGKSMEDAGRLVEDLSQANIELACLDLTPPGQLSLRVGGQSTSVSRRVERIIDRVARPAEVLLGADDQEHWRNAREFGWHRVESTLMKIPCTPRSDLEAALSSSGAGDYPRRYSVGNNVLWLSWPNERGKESLEAMLLSRGLSAVAVVGEPWGLLGRRRSADTFEDRLRSVLDPSGRFRPTPTAIRV
jgi:glycolate oxidase FAD binding subunit